MLLARRADAVAGERDAGRRNKEHSHARINSGQLQAGGIAGIWEFVGQPDIRFTGMEGVSDGITAFPLVDRGLRNIHAERAGGGNIPQRGIVGNREFKVAFGAEIGDGRIGIVLDVVLFGADQFAVVRLEDDDVRGRKDNLRILGDVEDLNIHLHGPRADGVVGGGELALRVAFHRGEKRHALHGAEKIDIRVGNRFAGGAVDNRAVNGSGERYGGGEKCGEDGDK